MERFLLLWDELDDLVGAARHVVLTAFDGLNGARRGAVSHIGQLIGALKAG